MGHATTLLLKQIVLPGLHIASHDTETAGQISTCMLGITAEAAESDLCPTSTEMAKKGCSYEVIRDVGPKHLLGERKQRICMLDNRANLASCKDAIGPNKL